MQKLIAHKPVKLVTDKSEAFMGVDEATYIKNYRTSFNINQLAGGETGGNYGVGTGYNSTLLIPNINKPAGDNVVVGAYNAEETNELYVWYCNSNKIHSIFCVDGYSLQVSLVAIGSYLNLSTDPKYRIAQHRAFLRTVYNSDEFGNRIVKEKILCYTDGLNWQRWINCRAAVATNGYDEELFPYFKTQWPHYDKSEFIDWAIYPPMIPPAVTAVSLTEEDYGKPNNNIDKSVQFAVVFINTDGRGSTLSPYSTPYIFGQSGGCNTSLGGGVRCLDLKIPAGSAHTERIQLLQRNCGGEWYVYDTIDKFSNCGPNAQEIIGNDYWRRVNPWEGYSYQESDNSITYRYCGDRELSLYSATDALRYQTDLPLQSVALTEAGDAALLGNNKYFYENLPCETTGNISIAVNTDQNDTSCPVKNVTIKVYAMIGRNKETVQVVWKKSADSTEHHFGSGWRIRQSGTSKKLPFAIYTSEQERFELNLGSKENFICYLAGTSHFAIGKQIRVDKSNNIEQFGVLDLSDSGQYQRVKDTIDLDQGYFLQEFEFNVPAGNYIARIAGHEAAVTSNYQTTSTYVAGVVARSQFSRSAIDSDLIPRDKELFINATEGDVNLFASNGNCFYIMVPWEYDAEDTKISFASFFTGHIYEDETKEVPVELVYYNMTKGAYKVPETGGQSDHNGFYFGITGAPNGLGSEVKFHVKANNGDFDIFTTVNSNEARRWYRDYDINLKQKLNGNYGPCSRTLIRGKISNCGGGQGLAGIAVTIQNSKTYYTNAQGDYEIIAHPRAGNAGTRNDIIVYNSSSACVMSSCSCSVVGIDTYNDTLVIPTPFCAERIYPFFFNKSFKISSSNQQSLKEGGRYPVGAAVGDGAGRTTFVQNIAYVDIPSFLETGLIAPSSLSWNLTGPLNLPKWAKWISFFIGSNLNTSKFLQWVGDKISFYDINGVETSTGNGAIAAKITIQSLLDYNLRNNFSTITTYQFVAGDRIRIYDNGEGVLYDTTTNKGFLDFTIRGTNFSDETVEDGKSLIIDYDERLLSLVDKCSFWIELLSPRDLTEKEIYCETANVYPVVNGEIISGLTTGNLNAYDSFFINRKIPVKDCSGKSFSHPFVSSSVSDFWGAGCNSCGRRLTTDDGVEQIWYQDDVIKSDDFINEGRVNGLGTFRGENRKNFKGNQTGGIVAMHSERGLIAFICQKDWFIADYNQNFLRANSQGLIIVNLDGSLSEPNQKIGNNFGCSYEDTATIDFFDGLCIWADESNSGVILMNYQSAADISLIDNKGYFINKFRYITQFNKRLPNERYNDSLIEKSGFIDAEGKTYSLTFRPRRGNSRRASSFVNNEREDFVDMQETIVFSLDDKFWRGFTGYTPEFYSRLKRSITGNEFVSFANGEIFLHNSDEIKTVNTFYGIKTEQVLEVVGIGDQEKDKLLQSISQDSRGLPYTIDSIKSDLPNVFSYLPLPYFNKKQGVYYGSVLRNTLVYPNKLRPIASTLIDGATISGLWFKVRLVRDVNNLDSYNELNYLFLRYITREKTKQ